MAANGWRTPKGGLWGEELEDASHSPPPGRSASTHGCFGHVCFGGGDESDDVLIPHMAKNPTLVQRPIGILNGKAAIGRPVDNLLTLS